MPFEVVNVLDALGRMPEEALQAEQTIVKALEDINKATSKFQLHPHCVDDCSNTESADNDTNEQQGE